MIYDLDQLKNIVKSLLNPQKGILAADESSKTIQKRFSSIGLESNPNTNLLYRKMLFTSPGAEEFLSGVILYDETIRQEIDGVSVPKYLASKGITAGIKTDKGLVDLPNFPGEKIAEGVEGLAPNLEEYIQMGAKFTKFRVVVTIGEGIPTQACLDANGEVLARYSAISQNAGLVPIIEPEVVRDGKHDLKKCAEVTSLMLKRVFERVEAHKVFLEGLILKTNMVTAGEDNPDQASPKEVAKTTIEVLLQSVPKELGGIVFLSGGQTPDMATENLDAINKQSLILRNKIGPSGAGWQLSYSFARALQGEALEIWAGKEENVGAAQKAFLERGKKVALARQGKLS